MSDWTINAKLADRLRGALPRPVFLLMRNWATALITPILFSRRTGHFKSSLRFRALDRHKNPIPWYTYSAGDFISGKDYTDRRVLEFGAGNSTLWWMRRAAEVIALEGSPEWASYLQSQVNTKVRVHLMSSPQESLAPLLKGRKFDVIVIDGVDGSGYDRGSSARCVLDMDLLAPGGAIILDDSEGSFDVPGNDWQKAAHNIELFRSHGFARVDFFGYAPAQLQWRCTSIFFKGNCYLFEGRENPRKSDA